MWCWCTCTCAQFLLGRDAEEKGAKDLNVSYILISLCVQSFPALCVHYDLVRIPCKVFYTRPQSSAPARQQRGSSEAVTAAEERQSEVKRREAKRGRMRRGQPRTTVGAVLAYMRCLKIVQWPDTLSKGFTYIKSGRDRGPRAGTPRLSQTGLWADR